MPKQQLIKQGASNLGNRGDGANSGLQLAAEVATHLRGGVNAEVAENLQKAKEELEGQVTGAPTNVADVPEFNPETMPAATLDERKTQRAKEQSWGDWLYEKTITKAAKRVGIERPSQRQIEDQVDETLTKAEQQERDKKAENSRQTAAAQKVRGERNKRRATVAKQTEEAIKDVGGLFKEEQEETQASKSRRAAPFVQNPIADQIAFPGQAFNFNIDPYHVFNDTDGDPLVVTATRSDNSSLPDWLGFGLLELGSVTLPSAGNRAAIAGNFAYVTDALVGLQIINITDPNTPAIVGSVTTPGLARSVAVANNYAYVAGELQGMQIVDVTTPESPILIKELSTPGEVNDVKVVRDTAYLAAGSAGLQIANITMPGNATIIGNIDMGGNAQGLDIVDSYAYVAVGLTGVQVFNVSDVTSPSFLKLVTTPGFARDVTIDGSYAYVADDNEGLHVLDVTDLANPVMETSVAITGWARTVKVKDNILYLAEFSNGLSIYSVTDPASPILLGRVATAGDAEGIALGNKVGLISDQSGEVNFLDLSTRALRGTSQESDAENIVIKLTATTSDSQSAATEFTLVLQGAPRLITPLPDMPVEVGKLFNYTIPSITFSDPNDDIITYSATISDNNALPAWLSLDEINGLFIGTPQASDKGEIVVKLTAFDSYATGASDYFIFHVVTFPTVMNPILDQVIYPGTNTLNLNLQGGEHFYSENGEVSLSVEQNDGTVVPGWMQITQPNPSLAGSFDTPGDTEGVYYSAPYVYVTEGDTGLRIIDVSNPAAPFEKGYYDTPRDDTGVYYSAPYAYVAGGSAGLRIIDVSNPAAPYEKGYYDTPNSALGVYYSAPYAYVADNSAGLRIIDVSNPAAPYEKGYYDTPGWSRGVYYSAPYAYVADNTAGLRIIDVSDPAAPYEKGYYDTEGKAAEVYYSAPYAYVADGDASGLRIIDVSNPAAPYEKGYYETHWASGVYYSAPYAYVADSSAGLRIIDVSNPAAPYEKGYYDTPGYARGVYYSAPYAYVADNTAGLQIIHTHFDEITLTGSPGLSDAGSYELTVIATDPVGATVTDTFILIVQGPPVLENALQKQRILTDAPFEYIFPVDTFSDPNDDVLTYTATLSNGATLPNWIDLDSAERRFYGYPLEADRGIYAIKLIAADGFGGTDYTIFDLDVGNRPFVANPIPDQSANIGSLYQYTFPQNVFIDPDNQTMVYSAELSGGFSLPSWLDFTNTTRTFSGTPEEGDYDTYSITVIAEDPDAGVDADTFLLDVEHYPVLVNPQGIQYAGLSRVFSYTIPTTTFNDVDGDTLTYSACKNNTSELPLWLNLDSEAGQFTGTPVNTTELGTLSIKVTAYDGRGGSADDTLNVEISYFPEVANPIPNQLAHFDILFTCSFPLNTFYDGDGDDLTYTAQLQNDASLPTWLSFIPGSRTFSGTPDISDAGTSWVKVTATDGKGSIDDIFEIAVENTAPTLKHQQLDQGFEINQPFVYTIPADTFEDVDGHTLTYSARLTNTNPLPDWLDFDGVTGSFSGTPTVAESGTYEIKVTASDGYGGEAYDIFNLEVDRLPVVANGIDLKHAKINRQFNFQFAENTFYDADGDPLTYTVALSNELAWPAWLEFYGASRTFTGMPQSSDYGLIEIKLTADDNRGGRVSELFDIKIDYPPEVNVGLPDRVVKVRQAMNFFIDQEAFMDLDGDVLSYKATQGSGEPLPDWMSFNPMSATFAGVPQESDAGIVWVKVIAKDNTGGEASDIFKLDVNNFPEVAQSIPDQAANIDHLFNYTIPDGTFTDVEDATLTYSSTLADDSALSTTGWLNFTETTQTFFGTPPIALPEPLNIKVIATDTQGGSVATTFDLSVQHFPEVINPILDQVADIGKGFDFTFDPNTFLDADVEDKLSYTASKADDTTLTTTWLTFDPAARKFFGAPLASDNLGVKVTAQDGRGGSVDDSFVIVAEYFPVVAQEIPDQAANIDHLFNYTLPVGTFTDVEDATLTYSSTLADDSALSTTGWLNFTTATQRFLGMPQEVLSTPLNIKVTAEDSHGGTATTTFDISVQHFPTVVEAIPNQAADIGEAFVYQLDSNTFADQDGDTLTLTATMADGKEWPTWLKFNRLTGMFSGAPDSTDKAQLTVRVTAEDGRGGSVYTDFGLSVQYYPDLENPIPNQALDIGKVFNYTLPTDLFNDLDGDTLTITVTLADGEELTTTGWLSYAEQTKTLSGTPQEEDQGLLEIKVTAADGKGGKVADIFAITTQHFPTLEVAIPDQVADIGKGFEFTFDPNTFLDADIEDKLSYTASKADDTTLTTTWLTFDPAARKFFGTPQASDNLGVKVTANDGRGGSVADSFVIVAEHFPVVAQEIPDQAANIDHLFNYTLPDGTFTDVEDVTLRYSSTLADDSALSTTGWLNFTTATQRFLGIPQEVLSTPLNIKVTAEDSHGGTATTTFDISVQHFPTVVAAIPNQAADIGEAFVYQLDSNTFADQDGDTLSLTASLADGSTWPTWLKFNRLTGMFSGTPDSTDKAQLTVRVTAEDNRGGSVCTDFGLSVQHYPDLENPIPNQSTDIGKVYNYTLPENLFTDVDEDPLTITVTLADGEELTTTGWLSYAEQTKTLSGTPQEENQGLLEIKVTAADGKGGTVEDIFALTIQHFPTVETPIPNQVADIGAGFDFTFEPNTFTDLDADILTYEATEDDDSELPAWLSFDPVARRFYGTPTETDSSITVKVTAKDGKGGSVSDRFKLLVSTPIEKPKVHKPGEEFHYVIDPSIFADVPETITGYQATLVGGMPLPSWLTFDETRLTLSGQSPVSANDIEVEIAAITPTGEQYRRAINFVFTENRVPVVQNRISNQVATVDQAFSFVIPGDTFRDLDGDELSYSAQAIGEEEWPTWLRFNKATRTFSGTPSRSDTNLLNTLTSRVIPLEVQASDAVGSGETTFSITVEGQSWLESGLQVGSAAATVFAVYRNRSLFLNRARDLRGRKTDEAIIGKRYSRRLTISEKNIRLVKTQVRRKSVPLSCGNRFFCGRWPYIDLPEGGEFPRWLKYDPRTCMLSGTPQAGDERDFIVQVIGSGGVIKEWFELTVRASKLEESVVIDVNAETFLEEDASMPSLPLAEGVAGALSTAQLLTQAGLFGSEEQQGTPQDIAGVELEPIDVDTPAAATAQPAPKPAG